MTALPGCNAIQSLLGVNRGALMPIGDDRVAMNQPAPLFYVEAPSTASANVAFTLTPWVLLAPGTSGSLPKFGLLSAQVDPVNHTITVSGKSTRFDLKPGATPPARVSPATAATQSITATASAGTYEIRIPADSFVSEIPPLLDWNGNPMEHPQPMATRSITIE
jgi:hypothetical protein